MGSPKIGDECVMNGRDFFHSEPAQGSLATNTIE